MTKKYLLFFIGLSNRDDAVGAAVAIDGTTKRFAIGNIGFAENRGKINFGKVN